MALNRPECPNAPWWHSNPALQPAWPSGFPKWPMRKYQMVILVFVGTAGSRQDHGSPISFAVLSAFAAEIRHRPQLPMQQLGSTLGCERGCHGNGHFTLRSNNNPYASFGATLARDEEQNLWSTPHDVTHTEADDDRVLYNMIVVRNQLDKDSEEWQKLNYDIYTLRQTRKEVRSRWKHILEDLGFQKEADSLLSVTKLSIISDSQNMGKARDILLKLSEETNIFPTSWELSERYLFVVDRLIALDAADEFFKMASVVYPKRPSGERVDDSQKAPQCISAVMP
ncbi:PREDICTED: melanoregulin [Aptenodytes forsteri]|nr:PREDICTED: melanoregulin [Aptenodytes forsteri]